ncbi:MAG: transcriptional regulator, AraC family [Paenibacillus sp.]|nr:transcriptional regulator, AraC family [Paenibacillus sp.]
MLGTSGVTGLQTSSRQYQSTGGIGSIIVTFKPGGLAAFTPYPIAEFQDANIDLDCIFPKQSVRDMEYRLQEAASAAERVQVVQSFLLSQHKQKSQSELIAEAAERIQLRRGDVSVERLAGELFVSKRTLERRFNAEIGITPKKFAGIVRFQRAIQLKHAGLSYLDLIESCNFSDHSHFAHDFKAFAGCTPEQFFGESLQPELAEQFNERKADSPVTHTMYQ